MAETENSPEESLRVQYNEVNEWARHFSNVRMTVTPVLAGLSLGIMQFAIGKQGWNAWIPGISSALLWITAILILVSFTYHTNRTREHCAFIQSLFFPDPPAGYANVLIFEKWMPPPAPRAGIAYMDFPAWIGILLTLGYACFWVSWCCALVSA